MAENEKLEAATRLEKLLDNIAGGDNEITPATRLEKFLGYIADYVEDISEGSGGGGSIRDIHGPYGTRGKAMRYNGSSSMEAGYAVNAGDVFNIYLDEASFLATTNNGILVDISGNYDDEIPDGTFIISFSSLTCPLSVIKSIKLGEFTGNKSYGSFYVTESGYLDFDDCYIEIYTDKEF